MIVRIKVPDYAALHPGYRNFKHKNLCALCGLCGKCFKDLKNDSIYLSDLEQC